MCVGRAGGEDPKRFRRGGDHAHRTCARRQHGRRESLIQGQAQSGDPAAGLAGAFAGGFHLVTQTGRLDVLPGQKQNQETQPRELRGTTRIKTHEHTHHHTILPMSAADRRAGARPSGRPPFLPATLRRERVAEIGRPSAERGPPSSASDGPPRDHPTDLMASASPRKRSPNPN